MSNRDTKLAPVPATHAEDAIHSAFCEAHCAFLSVKGLVSFIGEHDLANQVNDEVFFALRDLVRLADQKMSTLESLMEESGRARRGA